MPTFTSDQNSDTSQAFGLGLGQAWLPKPGAWTGPERLQSNSLFGSKTLVVADQQLMVFKSKTGFDSVHRCQLKHCQHIGCVSHFRIGAVTTWTCLLLVPAALFLLYGLIISHASDAEALAIVGLVFAIVGVPVTLLTAFKKRHHLRLQTNQTHRSAINIDFLASQRKASRWLEQLTQQTHLAQQTANQPQ